MNGHVIEAIQDAIDQASNELEEARDSEASIPYGKVHRKAADGIRGSGDCPRDGVQGKTGWQSCRGDAGRRRGVLSHHLEFEGPAGEVMSAGAAYDSWPRSGRPLNERRVVSLRSHSVDISRT